MCTHRAARVHAFPQLPAQPPTRPALTHARARAHTHASVTYLHRRLPPLPLMLEQLPLNDFIAY